MEATGKHGQSPVKRLDQHQISFNSVSSSESGLDFISSSNAESRTVPLRITRMPLFDQDYIQQRKSSVENLLARTPEHYPSLQREPLEKKNFSGESPQFPTSNSCDIKNLTAELDPYFYLQVRPAIAEENKTFKDETPFTNTDVIASPCKPVLNVFPSRQAISSPKYAGKLPKEPKNELTTEDYPPYNPKALYETKNFDAPDSVPLRPEKPTRPEKEPSESEHTTAQESPITPRNTSVCTPPKSHRPSVCANQRDPEVSKMTCCSICCETFISLFKLKYICSRFSVVDLILTLGSVGMFFFDVVTDLLLSLRYYRQIEVHNDYRFFFGLTLSLVIIPSIIVQIFSFWWVCVDYCRQKKQRKENHKDPSPACVRYLKMFFILVLHVFQLAPVFRYLRAMYYGFQSRRYEVVKKEDYREHFTFLLKLEMNDVNMLRLLESFLESAPQLVLQIYIMLITQKVPLLTVITCVGSLFALSTMMVSFQRAIRQATEKPQLSVCASIIMFCWRACTILSRVLAFALFLTIQPFAFLVFVLLHWMLATILIGYRGTHFCGKKFAELLFDGICGLIYVFCFLNLSDNKKGWMKTRCLMIIFYIVVFLENLVLAIGWFYFRPGGGMISLDSLKNHLSGNMVQSNHVEVTTVPSILRPTEQRGVISDGFAVGLVVAVVGFFILGQCFMIVYYLLLHPKKKAMECCCMGAEEKNSFQLVSAPLNGTPPEQGAAFEPQTNVTLRHRKALEAAQEQFGSEEYVEATRTRQENSGQAATVVRRRKYGPGRLPSSENLLESRMGTQQWQRMIFDRGERARVIHKRMSSADGLLDGETEPPLKSEGNLPYESRQTDRFRSIVTPTREKKHTQPPEKHSILTAPRVKHPQNNPSIVIKPGSQNFNSGNATRSFTHQGPLSTYSSPRRVERGDSPLSFKAGASSKPRHTQPSCPPPVQTRDYSASMSCLMGKPLSYVARREMALGRTAPRAPSFTIAKNEVIESIESSL